MMSSSSDIDITLFNATINAYPQKRPKEPIRKYNIKQLFEKTGVKFPLRLNSSSNSKFVQSVIIDSVRICLPGGRGCVGKERMGSKLTNRQAAMKNKTGIYYSPKYSKKEHEKDNPKIYGFLQLSGTILYKDSSTSNINVPIDASGVIGLRTGVSKSVKINPKDNNAGNDLMIMIEEIETILLNLLDIKKERSTRLEMINANFNLYTTNKKNKKTGIETRPRIDDFLDALDIIHKGMEKNSYLKASTKWLQTQGRPCVMKGTFKPVSTDVKKFPTLSLSPYGLVEMQGANSFKTLLNGYNNILNSYEKSKHKIELIQPNKVNNSCPIKLKKIESSSLPKITTMHVNNNGIFRINKKPCNLYPKSNLIEFVKQQGLSDRGTKDVLCNRLKDVMYKKKNNIRDELLNMKKQLANQGITLLKEDLSNKSNEEIKNNYEKYKNMSSENKIEKLISNKNSLNFKVPPKLERVKAIMNKMKISRENAENLAKNPFYNMGIPWYMQKTPIRGNIKTLPKDHPVYKISKFYPPPEGSRPQIKITDKQRKQQKQKKKQKQQQQQQQQKQQKHQERKKGKFPNKPLKSIYL